MTTAVYFKLATKVIVAVAVVSLALIADSFLMARRFLSPKPPQSPIGVEQEIPPVNIDQAQSRLAFPLPVPAYVPPGLVLGGAHVQAPNWANVFYVQTGGGTGGLGVEESLGSPHGRYVFPDDAKVAATVGEHAGFYVQGSWDEHRVWHAEADANFLQWSTPGETYRISSSGLGLRLQDLIKIAVSLR